MSADPSIRRAGAILFTDLVGFTEFTECSGDRAALATLDHQSRVVEDVVGESDGARVVKELGDGLLIWFDQVTDGAERALALLGHLRTAHRDGAFPLAVRMGLHHGEVMVRGEDLVGRNVNLASRIAALAGPGELLVSEEVARACPEVALVPIGPTRVRGIPGPVWLYRALVP